MTAEATLHWLLQTPNPHSDDWAISYLALETSIPTAPAERVAALHALRLAEQRVKNTVERQALARAVSSFMAGKEMDSAKQEALQRAVTAAGYEDLVGAGYTLDGTEGRGRAPARRPGAVDALGPGRIRVTAHGIGGMVQPDAAIPAAHTGKETGGYSKAYSSKLATSVFPFEKDCGIGVGSWRGSLCPFGAHTR
jgi:hypothetical protein